MTDELITRVDRATATRGPRPPEAWIVSILLVFVGGLSAFIGAFLLALLVEDTWPGQSVFGVAFVWNVIALAASLAHVLSGVFVLLGREWARRLAVGICVFSIVSSIPLLVTGAVIMFVVGVVTYSALIVSLNRHPLSGWTR